jgi:hypothetical protein
LIVIFLPGQAIIAAFASAFLVAGALETMLLLRHVDGWTVLFSAFCFCFWDISEQGS